MKRVAAVLMLVYGVIHSMPVVARQECKDVCTYPCIEYYPNGTDCKKTEKVCEPVCREVNDEHCSFVCYEQKCDETQMYPGGPVHCRCVRGETICN